MNPLRFFLALLLVSYTAGPVIAAEPAKVANVTELLAHWEGLAPDGSKVSYLFSADGRVIWTIGANKPVNGRYEAKKKAALVELDIFDFDLPHLAGFRFLGIAEIKGEKMKFFGIPSKGGKNRDGSPATHPKEFPGDAIVFSKVP
ncbi:MAG TPA: hypothetical protein VHO24_16395 [Opitutaceae bacterium]|nr:hypothetical protein [Opitutaceae bacterium]